MHVDWHSVIAWSNAVQLPLPLQCVLLSHTHRDDSVHHVMRFTGTLVVMPLRLRFRRSRFTLLFACLIVLTAIVYAFLNILAVTSNRHEQQQPEQRAVTSGSRFSTIIVNSSSSTQHPETPAPIRLLRKFTVQTTTQFLNHSNSDNATDDVRQLDTGMEEKGSVTKQENVELHVKREVSRLHLRPPKSIKYAHGQWQIVDVGRQVYIYSAFYDNRPGVDWPQVRIIAVAEFYGLCCLLWYNSQRLPDVAVISVVQVGPKISPSGQTALEQVIFSCRLDPNKTDTPTSVSLVAAHNFQLSNLLPVEVPEQPKHVIEFGHCMSILYWKQDPFQLVEWLEAHRMWGVGEVNIYTTATDNVTDSILRWYSATGFVNHRQSPGPLGDYNEYAILLSMSPVINDCMYRNMYRYRYVVCTDVDEMIVPGSPHRNYSEMLRAAAAVSARANAIVHSYVFRNTYFFLDFGATEEEPWYLLTQRLCVIYFIL